MKIIVAFDSFKGCLPAVEACEAARQGVLSRYPDAEVVCLPLSDGGEGLVASLTLRSLCLQEVCIRVHGPLMEPVDATYAISADGMTAFMEMAAACGLPLVPLEQRDPTKTTTHGLGEMMLDAVDRGAKHIVLGIGGSATCDGGKGMLECLSLSSKALPPLTVACDVTNPLHGPNGAAYVFAPQKGATPEQVEWLDQQLRDFAAESERLGLATPEDALHPGAGAAGGLGYALLTHLKAELKPGIEVVLDALHFDEALEGADIVITGEGSSDRQTLMGKVPQGVLQRAKRKGVPVVLMSGQIHDADALLAAGFSKVVDINEGDNRSLSILMCPEVAKENIQRASNHWIDMRHP